MPRQRTHYSGRTHVFPGDFPQRLERFKVESGLPWAEIARRLRTYPLTIRRWRYKGVRPTWLTRWRCLIWPTTWAWAISSPSGASSAKPGTKCPARLGAPVGQRECSGRMRPSMQRSQEGTGTSMMRLQPKGETRNRPKDAGCGPDWMKAPALARRLRHLLPRMRVRTWSVWWSRRSVFDYQCSHHCLRLQERFISAESSTSTLSMNILLLAGSKPALSGLTNYRWKSSVSALPNG